MNFWYSLKSLSMTSSVNSLSMKQMFIDDDYYNDDDNVVNDKKE